MAKAETFSSRIALRVTKTKNMDMIKTIYKENNNFSSINGIINEALDIGLPCILQNTKPTENIEKYLTNATQRIIMNQTRNTKKIIFNIRKINVLQSVAELMIGSLLKELEFFLQTNGITLDEKMLDNFKESIPTRFEEDKEFYIDKLLGDE